MYLIGKIRLIDITFPANQANSGDLFRPPEGMEWIYHSTHAQHNNVAATSLYWYMFDAVTGKTLYIYGATVATNANVFMERASTRSFDFPLKGTHNCYPRANFAPEAGKRLIVRSIILERPENFDLMFLEFIAHKMGFKLPVSSRE
jgi:hypothetical protein